MRSRVFVAALAVACAAALFAQDPAPKPKPEPPAKPAAAAPATPAAPTDLETAQMENIQLRMALLEDEAQSLPQRRTELVQRYGALVQKIESEHPGYSWNPQAGRLVPTPAPAPAAKPKAEAAKK